VSPIGKDSPSRLARVERSAAASRVFHALVGHGAMSRSALRRPSFSCGLNQSGSPLGGRQRVHRAHHEAFCILTGAPNFSIDEVAPRIARPVRPNGCRQMPAAPFATSVTSVPASSS
jgi:hypothetical protein